MRRAREARGLSLDDLVQRTKISRTMLLALEAMDVAHLPAATYTRGFVMAYAREVGLDPSAAAAAYLAAVAEESVTVPVPAPGKPASSVTRPVDLHFWRDAHSGVAGWAVIFGCAVGLVLYLSSDSRDADTSPIVVSEASTPNDPSRAAADHSLAGPDAVTAAPPPLPAPPPEPIRIELRADGACWISAVVDGQPVLSRLLPAGARHTLEVNDAVTLRIGEPGALRYTIDGREGRPFGRAGQPVTVRITHANLQEFLSR